MLKDLTQTCISWIINAKRADLPGFAHVYIRNTLCFIVYCKCNDYPRNPLKPRLGRLLLNCTYAARSHGLRSRHHQRTSDRIMPPVARYYEFWLRSLDRTFGDLLVLFGISSISSYGKILRQPGRLPAQLSCPRNLGYSVL